VTPEQDALVAENARLARWHVNRYMARYPRAGLDDGDLYGHALETLWACARDFDDSRGIPFEAYAVQRLKWAIVDRIRWQLHRLQIASTDSLDRLIEEGREPSSPPVDGLPGDVLEALDALTPRERRIVLARYGVGVERMKNKELAAELGLSIGRITQIEQAALAVVRDSVNGSDSTSE
jgi:RNA polymerase sigma factor (sigma-70 family)